MDIRYGPLLVVVLHAIVVAVIAIGLIDRLPTWWRMRHNRDGLSDIRLLQIGSSVLLCSVVAWDAVRWVGVVTSGRPTLGPSTESWPWDALLWALVLVAVSVAGIMRQRRRRDGER